MGKQSTHDRHTTSISVYCRPDIQCIITEATAGNCLNAQLGLISKSCWKAQKVAKHSTIMLTRIRLPTKLPYHTCFLWLVSCSYLPSRQLLSNTFCWSGSMKLSPVGISAFSSITSHTRVLIKQLKGTRDSCHFGIILDSVNYFHFFVRL